MKRHTRFALATLALCVLLLPMVRAQQSSSPEPQHGTSIAQELVRETREAAGEDDTTQLKHSGAVHWVSKLTGLDTEGAYWLCVALNFAVVAVAILWASKKYLPGAFRARTTAIQRAMEEARKTSEEANRRLTAVEQRLSRLDSEIAEMRAAADREASAEEERIRTAAEEDARKIMAAAEQELVAAAKSARRELTAYAADLAVTLARKQIHVDAATDHVLLRNFAEQIAANADSGKGRK